MELPILRECCLFNKLPALACSSECSEKDGYQNNNMVPPSSQEEQVVFIPTMRDDSHADARMNDIRKFPKQTVFYT